VFAGVGGVGGVDHGSIGESKKSADAGWAASRAAAVRVSRNLPIITVESTKLMIACEPDGNVRNIMRRVDGDNHDVRASAGRLFVSEVPIVCTGRASACVATPRIGETRSQWEWRSDVGQAGEIGGIGAGLTAIRDTQGCVSEGW